MDYTTMSLVELKKHAQARKIKQYYVMKRLPLIHLLSMSELPMSFKIEKKTIHDLRDEAKAKGIRGFWSLHRDELVDLLYPTAKQENEDGNQQESPQNSKSDEVGRERLQN